MPEQPEALRLADLLETDGWPDAAFELRRLEAAHGWQYAIAGERLRRIEELERQEPVAWLYRDSWGTLKLSQIMPPPIGSFPVYTTPPQRQPLEDLNPGDDYA
jgi:hypothetical protein